MRRNKWDVSFGHSLQMPFIPAGKKIWRLWKRTWNRSSIKSGINLPRCTSRSRLVTDQAPTLKTSQKKKIKRSRNGSRKDRHNLKWDETRLMQGIHRCLNVNHPCKGEKHLTGEHPTKCALNGNITLNK